MLQDPEAMRKPTGPAARRLVAIDNTTMHARVYDALRGAVMRGAFLPGEKITVRSLAEQFGTSPMPVREAIRRLVGLQAMAIQPNRTVIIPYMNPNEIDDLRRVRMGFEGLLTEWAASKITPAEISILSKINQRMRDMDPKKERVAYLQLNQDFHFTIYRAARSPKSIPVVESFWLQIGPYFNFVHDHIDHTRLLSFHRQAVTALRRRRGGEARQMIEANIDYAADTLLALLREGGES